MNLTKRKTSVKDYIKDTLKYSPVLAVSAIAALFLIPVITRLFHPEEYGRYALVTAILLFLLNFIGNISCSIVIRYLPKYSREEKGHQIGHLALSIFIVLFVLAGFLSWLFFYFAGEAVSREFKNLFILGFFAYICLGVFYIMLEVWRSQGKIAFCSIFYIVQIVGGLGLGLLLAIKLKLGVAALLWGNITVSAILLIPMLLSNNRFFLKPPEPILFHEARSAFLYGFFYMVSDVILWVIASSNKLIIGLLKGVEDAGIYSISYDFAEKSMLVVILLFAFAYKPMVINLWESDGEGAVRVFNRQVVKIFFTVCTPVALILLLLSKHLTVLLFAPQYLSGYPVIPFVIMAMFAYGLTDLMATPLVLHKKTQIIAGCMAIASLLNFSLSILLIPRFGMLAAAATTFAAYLVNFLIQRRFAFRYLRLELPYKNLRRVLIASLLMCVGVFLVDRHMFNQVEPHFVSLVILSLFGFFIYIAALFLMGEFKGLHLRLAKDIKEEIEA